MKLKYEPVMNCLPDCNDYVSGFGSVFIGEYKYPRCEKSFKCVNADKCTRIENMILEPIESQDVRERDAQIASENKGSDYVKSIVEKVDF